MGINGRELLKQKRITYVRVVVVVNKNKLLLLLLLLFLYVTQPLCVSKLKIHQKNSFSMSFMQLNFHFSLFFCCFSCFLSLWWLCLALLFCIFCCISFLFLMINKVDVVVVVVILYYNMFFKQLEL